MEITSGIPRCFDFSLSVDQKRFGLHFNCDSIPARNESRASYSDENALEVKDDAKNCIVSLLGQPNVFVLAFLLTLPPVAALQGEVIHEVYYYNNMI